MSTNTQQYKLPVHSHESDSSGSALAHSRSAARQARKKLTTARLTVGRTGRLTTAAQSLMPMTVTYVGGNRNDCSCCWKLVVVCLCRVFCSVTSPTLSVFVHSHPPMRFERSKIRVTLAYCLSSGLLWYIQRDRDILNPTLHTKYDLPSRQ